MLVDFLHLLLHLIVCLDVFVSVINFITNKYAVRLCSAEAICFDFRCLVLKIDNPWFHHVPLTLIF